jgi:hypothetical protein
MQPASIIAPLVAALACLAPSAWAQTSSPTAVIPAKTLLSVHLDNDIKMQVGRTVPARTSYPVYVDNQLVLPEGTEVSGTIVELHPMTRKARWDARSHGDFTPLRQATVRFDKIVLKDGKTVNLPGLDASNGVMVVRFVSAGAAGQRKSLARKLWGDVVGREKSTVSTFTAPGKGQRAKKMLYSQLPYHPQSVDAGTQYTIELPAALQVPIEQNPATTEQRKTKDELKESAVLSAKLLDDVNSRSATKGQAVKAVVTEPVLGKNDEVEVPQGTILLGRVTQVKPAGKWGRNGTVRFAFHEMRFPAGFTQAVHGSPKAVDADQRQSLAMDAEGGVTPQRNSVILPIAMGWLAASSLHDDEATVVHSGVASNGFALIGRVVAIASKSRYFAGGLGALATARATYTGFIGHGTDVDFPPNTRIEIGIDPVHSPIMHLKDEK